MNKVLRNIASTSGLGLLMLLSGQASAYICTGSGNEFADSLCDSSEISFDLGVPFDDTLLAKDDAPLIAGPEPSGSTAHGTLEVTQIADTVGGTVEFTYTGLTPQVIVEKADQWYSVYNWANQINSLGGDAYSFTREFGTFDCGAQGTNCAAETSHVAAYGVVPVPAAVWLFGSGLLGLIGIARRRRS